MILGGVYRRILSITWRKLSHYSQNSTSSVKHCALRDVRRTCLFTIPVSVTHLCTQAYPTEELLIPLKSETKEKRNAKPKKKKKITKKVGDSGLTQDQATTQTTAQCPDSKVLTILETETVSQEANSTNKRRKKMTKKNAEEKILGTQSHKENSTRKKRKRTDEEETLSVYFPFEGDSSTTPDDRTVLQTNDKQQSSAKTGEHLFTIKKLDKPGGRFYRISSDEGVCEFPSVTNVLTTTRTTQNFFMLRNWIQNMIKQHGMSGYERIRKETIRKGKNFHQLLENKLQLQSLQLSAQASSISTTFTHHPETVPPATSTSPTSNSPIDTTPPLATTSSLEEQQTDTQRSQSQENSEEDSGYLQSVHHVLQDISDIRALEGVTVHKELGYTGTFDCVAKYKDELCVIDWKTSVRPKPSLEDCYDFPLQATAYAGAINQDPHYPFKVFNALIVVAYPSGEPAHAHFISHEQSMHYWARWLARLKEYHTMFAHDLSEVHI